LRILSVGVVADPDQGPANYDFSMFGGLHMVDFFLFSFCFLFVFFSFLQFYILGKH